VYYSLLQSGSAMTLDDVQGYKNISENAAYWYESYTKDLSSHDVCVFVCFYIICIAELSTFCAHIYTL